MLVSPRFDTPHVLVVTSALAVAALVAAGLTAAAGVLLLGLLGLAGAGLIAGSTGQVGLAVGASPAELRTTGVGWAAALGRIGSILGPVAGGLLLAAGTPSRGVIAVLAAPLVVAGALALVLARRSAPALDSTLAPVPRSATEAPDAGPATSPAS